MFTASANRDGAARRAAAKNDKRPPAWPGLSKQQQPAMMSTSAAGRCGCPASQLHQALSNRPQSATPTVHEQMMRCHQRVKADQLDAMRFKYVTSSGSGNGSVKRRTDGKPYRSASSDHHHHHHRNYNQSPVPGATSTSRNSMPRSTDADQMRPRQPGHSDDRDRGQGKAMRRATDTALLASPRSASPALVSHYHHRLDEIRDEGRPGSYAMQYKYKKYQQQYSSHQTHRHQGHHQVPMRSCMKRRSSDPDSVRPTDTSFPDENDGAGRCRHEILFDVEPDLMDELPVTDVEPLPALSDHEHSLEEFETSRDDETVLLPSQQQQEEKQQQEQSVELEQIEGSDDSQSEDSLATEMEPSEVNVLSLQAPGLADAATDHTSPSTEQNVEDENCNAAAEVKDQVDAVDEVTVPVQQLDAAAAAEVTGEKRADELHATETPSIECADDDMNCAPGVSSEMTSQPESTGTSPAHQPVLVVDQPPQPPQQRGDAGDDEVTAPQRSPGLQQVPDALVSDDEAARFELHDNGVVTMTHVARTPDTLSDWTLAISLSPTHWTPSTDRRLTSCAQHLLTQLQLAIDQLAVAPRPLSPQQPQQPAAVADQSLPLPVSGSADQLEAEEGSQALQVDSASDDPAPVASDVTLTSNAVDEQLPVEDEEPDQPDAAPVDVDIASVDQSTRLDENASTPASDVQLSDNIEQSNDDDANDADGGTSGLVVVIDVIGPFSRSHQTSSTQLNHHKTEQVQQNQPEMTSANQLDASEQAERQTNAELPTQTSDTILVVRHDPGQRPLSDSHQSSSRHERGNMQSVELAAEENVETAAAAPVDKQPRHEETGEVERIVFADSEEDVDSTSVFSTCSEWLESLDSGRASDARDTPAVFARPDDVDQLPDDLPPLNVAAAAADPLYPARPEPEVDNGGHMAPASRRPPNLCYHCRSQVPKPNRLNCLNCVLHQGSRAIGEPRQPGNHGRLGQPSTAAATRYGTVGCYGPYGGAAGRVTPALRSRQSGLPTAVVARRPAREGQISRPYNQRPLNAKPGANKSAKKPVWK